MAASAAYRRTRERLVELASTLDEDAAAQRVPACPDWSVTDVYAHLSGSCDDILNGRLDGVTTDPWTEAQVAARRGMSLDDIVAEWTSNAEAFDDLVDSLGDMMDPRLFLDIWNHEQDVRGLLGVPGGGDDPLVADLLADSIRGWCIRVRRSGLDPFAVTAGDVENRSGDDPALHVTVDPFEFHRAQVGRRTVGQILEWDWQGDGPRDQYAATCTVFGQPTTPVIDAR